MTTDLVRYKAQNSAKYSDLLKAMFDRTPLSFICIITILSLLLRESATTGAQSAGLSYLRVPLGASDFSPQGGLC